MLFRSALLVTYQGTKQSIEKHLCDFWDGAVKNTLGEDVVLNYAIKLAQTFVTQIANDFKEKGQPFAEWYFTSPYGNPGTTETIIGYGIKELDLLNKYYKNKDWLLNEFAQEVYGSNEEDKKVFRLIVEQVPNIVLYVRSGMSRTGSDLTRAMAKDTNGYLVKTYVNLIVKATETGWVSRAVRVLEAYQNTPNYKASARAAVKIGRAHV